MTGPVRLVPMSAAGFETWSRHSVASFAAQQVASGFQDPGEATAYAEAQLLILLPDGMGTAGHHFWTVVSAGEEVGTLWLRLRVLPHETEAYVYDVEIVPAARGRGLGRATMLAAEEEARSRGADVLRLNVFGHNRAAISLYESLGLGVVRAALSKVLPAGASAPQPVSERASVRSRVELREMTPEEYVAVRPRLEEELAASLSRAGLLPVAAARRQAREDLTALLPRGRLSPGHLLRTAVVDGRAVGRVWLQLDDRPEGARAVLHLLETDGDGDGTGANRPGLLPALLSAVEGDCRLRGVTSVVVPVFGFDRARLDLYRECGFTLTAQLMAKAL
jgi:ribosomal protein S18 acetylase RimI-like enzyme